jgi:hypothetical protein
MKKTGILIISTSGWKVEKTHWIIWCCYTQTVTGKFTVKVGRYQNRVL